MCVNIKFSELYADRQKDSSKVLSFQCNMSWFVFFNYFTTTRNVRTAQNKNNVVLMKFKIYMDTNE